ncbi:hypothetical protein [Rhodococcus indonesiensis]
MFGEIIALAPPGRLLRALPTLPTSNDSMIRCDGKDYRRRILGQSRLVGIA